MRFPSAIAGVFLGVVAIGAPASAQEPAATSLAQPADAGLAPLDWTSIQAAPPSEPAHTGFKALIFETGSDFKAFPRRTSTWVILAIGGGAAAIAYPFDKEVTESFVNSNAAGNFFVAGKWIGSL